MKLKKRYKFALIILIWGIIIKIFMDNYHIIAKEFSSNNKNEIIVQAHEVFLFGPTPMTVRAKSTGLAGIFNRKKYDFDVYNDGKTVNSANVLVTWYDDETALIQIDCEESRSKKIKVNFNYDYEFKDHIKIEELE